MISLIPHLTLKASSEIVLIKGCTSQSLCHKAAALPNTLSFHTISLIPKGVVKILTSAAFSFLNLCVFTSLLEDQEEKRVALTLSDSTLFGG